MKVKDTNTEIATVRVIFSTSPSSWKKEDGVVAFKKDVEEFSGVKRLNSSYFNKDSAVVVIFLVCLNYSWDCFKSRWIYRTHKKMSTQEFFHFFHEDKQRSIKTCKHVLNFQLSKRSLMDEGKISSWYKWGYVKSRITKFKFRRK